MANGIFYDNRIIYVNGAFRPKHIPIINSILYQCICVNTKNILIDFSKCTLTFPNSMLPLIAQVSRMRPIFETIYVTLPKDAFLRDRFHSYNWAHYLSPDQYKPSDDIADRHLVTKQYHTFEEHNKINKQLVDLTLSTINTPRSSITALEWSLLEVMDNVLNHANSSTGGFVQLAVISNIKRLAFCVADCGQGIRKSLMEKYESLQSVSGRSNATT